MKNASTKTLVFVHGFLGGSAVWNEQVAVFSDNFKVVTLDLPGFGKNHHQQAPERIEAFAEYVLDTLACQNIDKFHLVGHSMGGMIAQEMTVRVPEKIDSLTLYGTGPIGLLPDRFETIAESKVRAMKDGAEATARRIAATWFLDGEKALKYNSCANIAALASLKAVLAGLSAMEAWDGKDALSEFPMPTLVLWGNRDRTYPWSQPETLWRTIPNSELAVIPGCAHNVHLEKPNLFNAVLVDFLSCH